MKKLKKCRFYGFFGRSGGFLDQNSPKLMDSLIFWYYWAQKISHCSIHFYDLLSYPSSTSGHNFLNNKPRRAIRCVPIGSLHGHNVNPSSNRLFRLVSAVLKVRWKETDRRTYGQTHVCTHGRTDPLMKMRERIKKPLRILNLFGMSAWALSSQLRYKRTDGHTPVKMKRGKKEKKNNHNDRT